MGERSREAWKGDKGMGGESSGAEREEWKGGEGEGRVGTGRQEVRGGEHQWDLMPSLQEASTGN